MAQRRLFPYYRMLVYDEYMDCVCATSKSVVVKPGWHPFFDHFAGSWEVEEENSILLETNEIELSLALSKEYLVGFMGSTTFNSPA